MKRLLGLLFLVVAGCSPGVASTYAWQGTITGNHDKVPVIIDIYRDGDDLAYHLRLWGEHFRTYWRTPAGCMESAGTKRHACSCDKLIYWERQLEKALQSPPKSSEQQI